MIRSKTSYEKIYFVHNAEMFSDKIIFDKLLMCETKNWDHYFHDMVAEDLRGSDFEEIENVELIQFDKEEEMFVFWEATTPQQKIGYSIEHEFPCVLKYQ